MQSELKSLSKIFSEVIFRIPDYQRGYSWEEKHLKDFWSDIEQLPEGKSHYTGVLTLEPVQKEIYERWDDDVWIIDAKRYTPMYVVDGQQRLTTAIVLLQSILDHIENGTLLNYTEKEEIRKKYIYESKDKGFSRSYIFGYEKDNPSYEFLKQSIFGEESINHSVYEETVYTKNLKFAKTYFAEKLKPLDKEGVESVFTTLTQHLQFNIFFIEKDLDVFVTFETMNNRGKLLSHLELLKNRLIYLSTKFEVDKTESELLRKAINESWKSIYHHLGKLESPKFDDDSFLRTHYICYFGPNLLKEGEERFTFHRQVRYEQQYKDYLLDEVFTPKRLNPEDPADLLSIEDVYKYSQSMKSLVKTYYHVAYPNTSNWSDLEKNSLMQINRLGDYGLFLLSVAIMSTFPAGKPREKVFVHLERMGFLSKLRPYYFASTDYLITTVKTVTNELTPESLTKDMQDFCDKFIKSPEFADSIKNIGKENGSGYYGWKQIRYFMYEYEQELKRLSKTSRQLLTWSNDPAAELFDLDHKTIEHIFPQKASDAYWKVQFSNYTVKERNMLKNSLGNLLPVSHGKNASLSNKSFEQKKGSEKRQVGYKYGCLSEIQVSTHEHWGAKEILRRGLYLLDFMETRWGVKIGDAAKKTQLLGLNFVLEREKITAASLSAELPTIPVPPAQLVEERDDSLEF